MPGIGFSNRATMESGVDGDVATLTLAAFAGCSDGLAFGVVLAVWGDAIDGSANINAYPVKIPTPIGKCLRCRKQAMINSSSM
jgi:hypothetical protein